MHKQVIYTNVRATRILFFYQDSWNRSKIMDHSRY